MTNKLKYVFQCLDDDEVSADPLCLRLQEAATIGVLQVKRRGPKPWEKEVASLIGQITKEEIQGCLLDYRLDEKAEPIPVGETLNHSAGIPLPVSYTADSLLQELRRRSVKNKESSFPIVLWSNADRLKQFREIDPSYQFHYDLTIDKEQIPATPTELSNRLLSLAHGYVSIRKAQGNPDAIGALLAAPYPDATKSPEAFFKNQYPSKTYGYHIALFILHEILDVDGPLIGETMLRAILGVELSSIGSKKFHDELRRHNYSGVFSEGYLRYWKIPLIRFLDSISNDNGNWLKLDAGARAAALAKRFKMKNLAPIPPIASKYSTVYDTVCSLSGSPLNRMNGFTVFDDCPRVWKNAKYVSAHMLRKTYGVGGQEVRLEDSEKRRFLAMFNADKK